MIILWEQQGCLLSLDQTISVDEPLRPEAPQLRGCVHYQPQLITNSWCWLLPRGQSHTLLHTITHSHPRTFTHMTLIWQQHFPVFLNKCSILYSVWYYEWAQSVVYRCSFSLHQIFLLLVIFLFYFIVCYFLILKAV